jgi:hypothetical protein
VKTFGLGLVLVAIFLSAPPGNGAETGNSTRDFMRQKLGYTQGVLEGITLEKYELIITNAALLRNMSQTNAFYVLKNAEYLQRITNFQSSVDALSEAARAGNQDRAAGAYSRVMQSCIECHKYFRRDQFVKRHSATH